MTKPDWAEKKVQRKCYYPVMGMPPMFSKPEVIELLRAEYKRALRVVAKVGGRTDIERYENSDYTRGYREACADILAGLRRGRG